MKILVGFRGANIGKDLLEIAAQHALFSKGKVVVMTSLPGGERTTREQVVEAETNLAEAKKHLEAKGVPCETHLLVRGRTPGEDLVIFGAENNCDEIVIGVKSRSKVGKVLFGSTAQYVILKAGCPVVSVK